MTRIVSIGLVAAVAGLALISTAGAAQSQTAYHPYGWRAPAAGDAGYSYGYAGVGTPLAEVQTRAYVRTGDYADGYTYGYRPDRYGYEYRYGYAPTRGYVSSHGYDPRYDGRGWREDRGGRYGYSERRYVSGYRDGYGYSDDRPPVRYRYDDHPVACNCTEHRHHDGRYDPYDPY